MVSPRRLRLHRGTRLESESDTGDADMDVGVGVDVVGPHTVGLPAGSRDENDREGEPGDGNDDDSEPELESERGVDLPSTSTATPARSCLRITLKMPSVSRTETPLVESEDEEIGSEDGDGDGDGEMDSLEDVEDEEVEYQNTKHPLTSRQAALASVMDPSHVSLESMRSRRGRGRGRGRLIGEAEMRLRKEETARKRKNFVEKRLEDEKAETINRLLKKQSRPRGKRGKDNNIAPPAADADSDEGNAMDEDTPPDDALQPPPPTMYRWISTSHVHPASTEPCMSLTFSVPPSVVPSPSQTQAQGGHYEVNPAAPPPRPTSCAAPGCGRPFRYRLVKDWTRGACGMECLKVLEAALGGA
ncbi:hypothetical protein E4T56_gene11080 [Termitomyces sp. T112]|nr:hypothetical protein E4T56_gene11080 [Termitomyces sp. T112]